MSAKIITNLSSVPNTTNAVYVTGYGKLTDVVHAGTIPVASLDSAAPGTVLVRMLAAPINPSDTLAIQGLYPAPPVATSDPTKSVPGLEGAGEVVAIVGGSNTDLQLGDIVIPSGSDVIPGSWRRHLTLPAKNLIRIKSANDKREKLTSAALASLTVNPTTAYRLLKDFVTLKAGDVVVQNGGNSAVGQFVAQLGKLWGVKVVSIVRDRPDFDAYAAKLKAQGAFDVVRPEHVLKYFTEDHKDLYVPLAFETIGGPAGAVLLQVVSPGGTVVSYGSMSGQPIPVSAMALLSRGVILRGFWLTAWKETATREQYQEMLDDLVGYIAAGKIETPEFNEIVVPAGEISKQESDKIVQEVAKAGAEFAGKKQLLVFQ
ncbi:hypothetical protein BCR44DRAFT_120916 [Catenaria anguillulae PL171]|uniref:enoyl-[acyl-carrier-protein] reductase n=1 Tax=Catenaria anguillulae PL171 TaxID=765915 RepID=A0A1Y2HEB3_9FUNG|nr:hypothetical protein BCR44DRAFT_120916 [Catenaria anguillulae PL171]